MKIALLGGTFNPIHQGHVLIARGAIRAFDLDRVYFVPCFIPPHKAEAGLASVHHRAEMVRLAIIDEPKCEVHMAEIRRGGPSYTVETLRALRAEHPQDSLHFIVGSDIFEDVGNWQSFAELAGICEFLVIERPGCPLNLPPPSVAKADLPLLRYSSFQAPTADISSSEVRRSISEGKNVSQLLPGRVYEYIQAHQLYLGVEKF